MICLCLSIINIIQELPQIRILLNSQLVQQHTKSDGSPSERCGQAAPLASTSIFARSNLLSETDPLQYSDYEDELAPFRTVEDDLSYQDHPASDINLLQLIDVK
jgi:hypothetical protein